jgi:hypothetical protein
MERDLFEERPHLLRVCLYIPVNRGMNGSGTDIVDRNIVGS